MHGNYKLHLKNGDTQPVLQYLYMYIRGIYISEFVPITVMYYAQL